MLNTLMLNNTWVQNNTWVLNNTLLHKLSKLVSQYRDCIFVYNNIDKRRRLFNVEENNLNQLEEKNN